MTMMAAVCEDQQMVGACGPEASLSRLRERDGCRTHEATFVT